MPANVLRVVLDDARLGKSLYRKGKVLYVRVPVSQNV